jgi:hypothetical protein
MPTPAAVERPPAARKRFVIGIGSQRAGTTLLHEVIDSCTPIYMHPLKELHYFDTLHGIRTPEALREFSRKQLQREVDRICAADEFRFIDKRFKNYLRSNFVLYSKNLADIDYLDLFRPCLQGHDTLGEITPEYMALPEAGVADMARVVGRDARIILVARNPVARVISSFKLLNVYNSIKLDPVQAEARFVDLIASDSSWIRAQDRLNGYQGALELYSRHFESVLLLRYDDFSEHPERLHAELSAFLGVTIAQDRFAAVLGHRKNELGASLAYSAATLELLGRRYREQSDFLAQRFGTPCVL